MGFGANFIRAISAIYLTPMAELKINGLSSFVFPLSRERRQGDLLSPLLFALARELLVSAI